MTLNIITISIFLSFITVAYAQLPIPIEQSLNEANIRSDDLSLVILPISNSYAENKPSSETINDTKNVNDTKNIDETKNTNSPDTDANTSSLLATALITNKDILNYQNELKSHQDSQSINKYSNPGSAGIDNKVISGIEADPLKSAVYHRPNISRTPASTMKLIPTFIALDLLGPDFVWFTKVYHTGYLSANTLYGDLIIKGSGDPKLTYQRLAKLLLLVKKAGIHHIEGDIILDSSIFREVGKDPAAFDNEPLRPYNASPDGLLINFNSIEMTTLPTPPSYESTSNNGQKTQSVKVVYSPQLANYQLPDSLPIRNSGRCSKISSTLAPVWGSKGLKFNKGLPQSCGKHSFYIAYPEPKAFAKRVVEYQWLNLNHSFIDTNRIFGNGTTLSGTVVNIENPIYQPLDQPLDQPINIHPYIINPSQNNISKKVSATTNISIDPASPVAFVSYPSLPLSQQIYDINHFSNNVMTEQVTLSLPVYTPAESLNSDINLLDNTVQDNTFQNSTVLRNPSKYNNFATYPKALSVINLWWQTHLKTDPPIMTNGSGLCRSCSVTANNLAELLGYAYSHPNFTTYLDSLGVAGISGTIAGHADRLPNSAAIGRAWIKTGTLKNVTSMAGYVHGQSGQDYIVVGVINNSASDTLNTYQARRVLDTMLDWTAQH